MDSFKIVSVMVGCALSVLIAWPVQAQEEEESSDSAAAFHADVEIDPLAYALRGYSVHVGVGYRRVRFDLGAFALDIPGFLEPSEHIESSSHGFGLKVQYFPFAEQSGGFVGAQADLTRDLIESKSSDAAQRTTGVRLGVQLGWRFPLGSHFFVTPWLLMSYDLAADDVRLDGETVEASAFSGPLPFVHLGYRFR